MTREEKHKIIAELVDAENSMKDIIDTLDVLFDSATGRLFDAWCNALGVAIKMTAAVIGDKGEWLDWYIHVCGCGKKPQKAVLNGEEIEVKTIDDLVYCIESEEKR